MFLSDQVLKAFYDLGVLLFHDLEKVVHVDLSDIGVLDQLYEFVKSLIVKCGEPLLGHPIPVELIFHPVAPFLLICSKSLL